MQPELGQLVYFEFGISAGKAPDDPDGYARLSSVFENPDHRGIAHHGIVNQDFSLRSTKKCAQPLTRVFRTHHQGPRARRIWMPFTICIEQSDAFLNERSVAGND